MISVISCLGLIVLWFLAALAVDAPIILPQPLSVLEDLFKILLSKKFIANVGSTVLRGIVSFTIIAILGTLFGITAGKHKKFEKAIRPLITLFKATPVMSIILLVFIWFKTGIVPVFSAFLMGFPVMFVQVLSGFEKIDLKLIQMCDVYHINGKQRIKDLIIPSLKPYIITGSKQTLSMIWKVVIAAEVLTVPKYGVGRELQLSQVQLETSRLFAWTSVAIILTALCDSLFNRLIKKETV